MGSKQKVRHLGDLDAKLSIDSQDTDSRMGEGVPLNSRWELVEINWENSSEDQTCCIRR